MLNYATELLCSAQLTATVDGDLTMQGKLSKDSTLAPKMSLFPKMFHTLKNFWPYFAKRNSIREFPLLVEVQRFSDSAFRLKEVSVLSIIAPSILSFSI